MCYVVLCHVKGLGVPGRLGVLLYFTEAVVALFYYWFNKVAQTVPVHTGVYATVLMRGLLLYEMLFSHLTRIIKSVVTEQTPYAVAQVFPSNR